MKIYAALSAVTLTALVATTSFAVEPDEMLANPVLEERARIISQDLKCVVCQNETIDESSAPLAQDMRRLVRQRILAGDSNQAVLDYMVDRYGDFVLLRPRVTGQTLLLWFGPFVLLLLGGLIVARYIRRPSITTVQALTPEELAEVEALTRDPNTGNEP
ncbi:MAG: cytochrome c-type biogenesis protein CcmH [Rhodospirillaceae bacterium]|mgnify:CR=1 FL=1|nr:cytochrome c-type biogenesis protein CcmH [Rhodospirillaceae bacterium]